MADIDPRERTRQQGREDHDAILIDAVKRFRGAAWGRSRLGEDVVQGRQTPQRIYLDRYGEIMSVSGSVLMSCGALGHTPCYRCDTCLEGMGYQSGWTSVDFGDLRYEDEEAHHAARPMWEAIDFEEEEFVRLEPRR